jgi:ribosomal protein S18 acetylase RimI-like enzyme
VAEFSIRPIQDIDRNWIKQFILKQWGAEIVVAHGVVFRPHELSGFIAAGRREPIGLITYQIADRSCEIVTLDSLRAGQGIGTALIETVKNRAKEMKCDRAWLITTNDNLNALRFYQKRGFELVAIHRHAIERSRQIKRQIPLIGEYGIPLRDEIELEYNLR